jgi:hypothetical protein
MCKASPLTINDVTPSIENSGWSLTGVSIASVYVTLVKHWRLGLIFFTHLAKGTSGLFEQSHSQQGEEVDQ